MVKHAVATGEYGNRSDEVEAGQAVLRERLGIALLRDAALADLEACKGEMTGLVLLGADIFLPRMSGFSRRGRLC
jgi:galactokinase